MDTPPPMLQNPPPGSENSLPSLLSLKLDLPEGMAEENTVSEVVLPQALEEVLALKTQRALELGTELEGNVDNQQTEREKESVLTKDDNMVCKINASKFYVSIRYVFTGTTTRA